MQARNLLDIYVPYRHHFKNGRLPVLIYVTGGAYMIGYKAWGAVLARRMSQCGVITCCLDYRNFPQVSQIPGLPHACSSVARSSLAVIYLPAVCT